MTVLFSTGYVLPGGDESLKNARILASNKWSKEGTFTATNTDPDYFVEAPANSMTYERWKPTSLPCAWTQTLTVAEDFSTCCVAGHTLNGCVVQVQYWTGAAWANAVSSRTIDKNDPIMFIFPSVNTTAMRLRIESGPLPEIAVIRFGNALQMPMALFAGHTPIDLGRMVSMRSNKSETGEFLGQTRQRAAVQTAFEWQYLPRTWVENNWRGFQRAIEEEPFFIAWRPFDSQYVGYCQSGEVPVPVFAGGRDYMSVSLKTTGLAYD
jgi:hypothetical protein